MEGCLRAGPTSIVTCPSPPRHQSRRTRSRRIPTRLPRAPRPLPLQRSGDTAWTKRTCLDLSQMTGPGQKLQPSDLFDRVRRPPDSCNVAALRRTSHRAKRRPWTSFGRSSATSTAAAPPPHMWTRCIPLLLGWSIQHEWPTVDLQATGQRQYDLHGATPTKSQPRRSATAMPSPRGQRAPATQRPLETPRGKSAMSGPRGQPIATPQSVGGKIPAQPTRPPSLPGARSFAPMPYGQGRFPARIYHCLRWCI